MARREIDLVLVVACSLALTAVILAFPVAEPARIALGLPFVLFFPGYALLAALFPRKGDLDPMERIPLSFGLSIATVPLIGLALNYSPWGIRLYPILAFVSLFIVLAAAVALIRRRRLPPDDAFAITVRINWLGRSGAGLASGPLILAIVPVAAAVGIGGYFLASSQGGGNGFTEFYMLGPDGRAESYPGLIRAGESAALTLGVANHEGKDVAYRAVVRIDGERTGEIARLRLANSQVWEKTVSLVPIHVGDSQKIEFLLYRDGGAEPYRSLHLWLDVKAAAVRAIPTAEAGPSPTPVPSPTPTPPPPEPAEALAEEQAPEPDAGTPEAPETPRPRVHVVVSGEYLSLIASRYEVPLDAVITANDLDDPNLIYPQQKILIPAGGAAGEGE